MMATIASTGGVLVEVAESVDVVGHRLDQGEERDGVHERVASAVLGKCIHERTERRIGHAAGDLANSRVGGLHLAPEGDDRSVLGVGAEPVDRASSATRRDRRRRGSSSMREIMCVAASVAMTRKRSSLFSK